MPIMFQDLRQHFMHYQKSNGTQRQKILDAAINEINKLPLPDSIHETNQLPQIYKTMAYTATLINYASLLHDIEVSMPSASKKTALAELMDQSDPPSTHPISPTPEGKYSFAKHNDWYLLHGVEREQADEPTDQSIVQFTGLQALLNFRTIKYSHVLILLANQLEGYNNTSLRIDNSWDAKQYNDARIALMTAASDIARLERETTNAAIKEQLHMESASYRKAYAALKTFTAKDLLDKNMKKHLSRLLTEIEKLKSKGEAPTQELTDVLTQTIGLFDGSVAPLTYEQTAKTMQGYPSQGMRVVGSIMLTICVAAVAMGLAGVAIPIAAALAGTFALATGVIFFASRQHGLSKAMSQLADDKAEENRAMAAHTA